ncbi:MAG TPA: alpha/beta hydrolase, partial [Acetobacteraceae bacterium]
MPLDADNLLVLEMIRASGRPPFETLTPAEARQAYAASRAVLQPDPEDVAEVLDFSAPGPHGDIPLRLYRPRGAGTEQLPGLVYYHGGGWLLGDIDSHDVICRRLANAARCVTVSVDYRMAPENKFPASVEDCAAATSAIIAQAASLGIDPNCVAVGGDSAGGNLAAVMALMARDGTLPPIAFQLLVYPATDMTMSTVSSQTITDGVPLTSKTMKWFIDHYMRSAADMMDWRASPARAVSLAGTAPALVITASFDPLRDEGIDYARRLDREGVRVSHLHFSDQMHGFLSMGRIIRAADIALDTMAA